MPLSLPDRRHTGGRDGNNKAAGTASAWYLAVLVVLAVYQGPRMYHVV